MPILRVLCAGAARAVVERIGAAFERETGCAVRGAFGAVGAMKARLLAGEAADVVILTAAMIEELAALDQVVAGSRADLGRVGTGAAVRSGAPRPEVRSVQALRANLLAARSVVCPDPAVATAGKVVLGVLERLGIAAEVAPRLRVFPDGYTAMRWLAASRGALELGITQITEILPSPGVCYVGALPEELQRKTVYAAGLASRARDPDAARQFIARLTASAARPVLRAAGYELDG